MVERWHRTLLAKLYRYFTHKNTTHYVDVIQDLVKSYNDSYHSSIKIAPSQVGPHNDIHVRQTLFAQTTKKQPKTRITRRFRIGDTVRISGARLRIPSKGYREKWTKELFNVVKIYKTVPITYGLTDLAGEKIKGKFYGLELIKAVKEIFAIEKVLKTKRVNKGGKTKYFVKWLNYPDKFNSWTDHINA